MATRFSSLTDHAWPPWAPQLVAPLIAVALAIGTMLLALIQAPPWVRAPVAIAFLMIGPGLALVPLAGTMSRTAVISLSLGLSTGLAVAVACLQLYSGAWAPPSALRLLVGVTLVGALAQGIGVLRFATRKRPPEPEAVPTPAARPVYPRVAIVAPAHASPPEPARVAQPPVRPLPLPVALPLSIPPTLARLEEAWGILTKPLDPERILMTVVALNHLRPGPALLVERDAAARGLLRTTLRRQGWVTAEATTRHELLERLTAVQPQLIVLDQETAAELHRDLISIIRDHYGAHHTPILVLRAGPDSIAPLPDQRPGPEAERAETMIGPWRHSV